MKSSKSFKATKEKDLTKPEDKRDIARLIDYYRLKSELSDKEIKLLIEKLENLQLTQEEQHKLEWENKKRQDEIIELQNLLSQNNDILNKERRQMLIYQFELQHKDHRSKEDRKRLMQLLSIAEPIEQTINLYYDKRPDIKEKYAICEHLPLKYNKQIKEKCKSPITNTTKDSFNTNTKKQCSSHKLQSNSSVKRQKSAQYRISPSDEKQHIMKTVILPKQKDEETLLQQEVEYLKKQIKHTRSFYENQLNKMEESKQLKEEETKLALISASERIEDLIKRNQKLEKLNYELTKDYMHLKYDSGQVEKRLYEELEMMKLQNESLNLTINEVSSRAKIEKEFSKNDFERKNREIAAALRSQLKQKEDHNALIKEQYSQIQKLYSDKLIDLEEKLKNKTQKLKIIEFKRNNDLEGFLNEMSQIRKRMKSYENYVYKLKQYLNQDTITNKQLKEDLEYNESDFNSGLNKLKADMSKFEKRIISGDKSHDQTQDQMNNQRESNDYNNNFNFDDNNENENNQLQQDNAEQDAAEEDEENDQEQFDEEENY